MIHNRLSFVASRKARAQASRQTLSIGSAGLLRSKLSALLPCPEFEKGAMEFAENQAEQLIVDAQFNASMGRYGVKRIRSKD